ncbi:MAG: hypothetical protein OXE17_02715 [Chloroflexi bacterium]|nr:hypothetical protein [Chloroflexota bacterium]
MSVQEFVARWEDETDFLKFLVLIALKTDFRDWESWDDATQSILAPLRRIKDIYGIDAILDAKELGLGTHWNQSTLQVEGLNAPLVVTAVSEYTTPSQSQ